MAEAFARKHGLDAYSAGTHPSDALNPMVVKVMKEKGVDLSASTPKMLTTEMIERADVIITMGCSVEEVCPAPMIARMKRKLLDWGVDDPAGKTIEEVRRIRDEIERKVERLSEARSR